MQKENIGYLIRATSRLMRSHLQDALSAEGMNLGQYWVLRELLYDDAVGQQELSARAQLQQSHVVLILDAMEREGWVRRARSEVDRRKINVHLTPSGRALIRRVDKRAERVLEGPFGLSADEIELCRSYLLKLRGHLESAET
jgi:DNA-binding MarR family transcriptional regulator